MYIFVWQTTVYHVCGFGIPINKFDDISTVNIIHPFLWVNYDIILLFSLSFCPFRTMYIYRILQVSICVRRRRRKKISVQIRIHAQRTRIQLEKKTESTGKNKKWKKWKSILLKFHWPHYSSFDIWQHIIIAAERNGKRNILLLALIPILRNGFRISRSFLGGCSVYVYTAKLSHPLFAINFFSNNGDWNKKYSENCSA